MPAAVLGVLLAVMDRHGNLPDAEQRVVRVWIALLAKSPAGDGLTAAERTTLMGSVLGGHENRTIRTMLAPSFANVSGEAWFATAHVSETVP